MSEREEGGRRRRWGEDESDGQMRGREGKERVRTWSEEERREARGRVSNPAD